MTTSLMPEPRQRYFTNTGTPAAGCKLYTYAAGTTTPKATYQDSAGTVPNTNPITLDSKGEAVIYWSGAYKVDLKTALGVQITGYPVDNFVSPITAGDLSASSGAGLVGFLYSATYVAGTIGKWLKDLATSIGSSLIGFIQAGIGAVAWTVQDKLQRESVSTFDFMTEAQRDDVTAGTAAIDCTAAIQAAIQAMFAQGGGLVRFPRGRYKCGALTMHSNVRLVGDVGAYQADTTSGVQLVLFGNNINGIGATNVLNIGVENIRIDGTALTGTFNVGLHLNGFWLSNFKNVTVVGIPPAKGYGIKCETGTGAPSFGAQHNLFEMCECPDGIVRFEGKSPSDQVTTTVVNTLRGYQYENQHCQITYINATAEAWTVGSGFFFNGSGDSVMVHCDIEGTGPVGITIGDTHVVRELSTIWVGYSGPQRYNGQLAPITSPQATVTAASYFPDPVALSDNNTTFGRLRFKADSIGGGAQEGHFEINRRVGGADVLQFEWRKQWRIENSKSIANVATTVFSIPIPTGGGVRVKATAWCVEPGAGPFTVARETVCVNNFGALAKTDGAALAVQTGGSLGAVTFTISGTNLLVQANHGSPTAAIVSFVLEVDGEIAAVLKI